MDEFLREINAVVFRLWILNREDLKDVIKLKEDNPNTLLIETKVAKASISFHDQGIIELSCENKLTGDSEFYLHFQMNTFNHAIKLLNEMLECLHSIEEKPNLRILLSCSSGLTTSLYASMLTEAAQVLNLNYEFNAVAYTELEKEGPNWDVIILAPQIAYMQQKITNLLKNKIVLVFPSQVFAKYDAGAGIKFIQEEMDQHINKKEIVEQPDLEFARHKNDIVLSLSIVSSQSRKIMRLESVVYDGDNKIIYALETRKKRITVRDLKDIINSILAKVSGINLIAIAMPGIINDGHVAWNNDYAHINLRDELYNKYKIPVVLNNDVNATAIGYYVFHKGYHNLAFIYQPVGGYGGAGIIVNDKLLQGRKNIGGEFKYVPMKHQSTITKYTTTQAGTLKIMKQNIETLIAMNGPDLIVYYSELVPDHEELMNALKEEMPEEYLPEIIKSNHVSRYIQPGNMILALEKAHRSFG